jgi:xanthine dehydrogenase accessory factor
VAVEGGGDPASDDLALVVAAHGRDELHTLRRGLEAGVPYVGLVASTKRGAGVLADLRADGVAAEHLGRIDVPAGIDIGARAPAEIALSILAQIVAVRRGKAVVLNPLEIPEAAASPSRIAVDPICGMTVAVLAGTPSVEHDGETMYFCCEGCKARFEAQHAVA